MNIDETILKMVQIPVNFSVLNGKPETVGLDQFKQIPIGIKGVNDSNKFLLSFCNQLDINLYPDHSPNVTPWFYCPKKMPVQGNISCRIIGKVQTKIGHFTIAYLTDCRKDIGDLYVYSSVCQLDYQTIFSDLVENAKKQMNIVNEYLFQAIMDFPIEGVIVEEYIGENFSLSLDNGSVKIVFRVRALTQNEAQITAINRMVDFTAFISQETNLCWQFRDLDVTVESLLNSDGYKPYVYRNYIDQHPIAGIKLLWGECGYKFINEQIFIERGVNHSELYSYVISGCRHVKEGLLQESRLGSKVLLVIPQQIIEGSPRDSRDKQAFSTLAMMNYLSAIESATMIDSQEKKCGKCGAVIYGISKRVKEIVSKYMNLELGEAFKQLYNYRSKFLHAGKYPIQPTYSRVIPQIDITSATGLEDTGFFSILSNGNSQILSVVNIREWTTFVLRCYYQDKIYGVTDFYIPDSDDNSDGLIPHFGRESIAIVPKSGLELVDIVVE